MLARKPIEHAVSNAALSLRTARLLIETLVFLLLISVARVAIAETQGDYTPSQADAGRLVFSQHCAQCHGANLEGQAGPPLAGPEFASNLAYS